MVPCTHHLECPNCRGTFSLEGRVLVCDRGHAFDRARAGYINLLPSRKKLADTVGDNTAMLEARAAFLGRGHFTPLADEVVRMAPAHLDPDLSVVEVGTGTGYYLNAVKEAHPVEPGPCFIGIDISKAAAKKAARANPGITWVVGDVRTRLPLRSTCTGVILDVFAPRNPDEFTRLLHPEGALIVALPAPDHLHELIEELDLLKVPEDKEATVVDAFSGRLSVVERRAVQHELTLDAQDVQALVGMGPNARHTHAGRVATTMSPMRVTASFVVLRFGLPAYRPSALWGG